MAVKKRMKIHLLGTPTLFWDDKPITPHRKMVRFLIYYLSLKKGKLGRTEIALEFWPDEINSRQHLRDLLSKARQELPDPNIILTDRDWVGLDHDMVEVDVIEFEELYQQLTLPFLSVENRPLPEAVFQKMINAVNMWETPNLMSGISTFKSESLEDWIQKNNKRLQNQRLDLMIRISQHLIAVGDLDSASNWLAKIIELDFDYEYPLAVFLKIEILFRLQKYSQAFSFGKEYIEEVGYDWFDNNEIPLRKLMAQIDDFRFRSPENISTNFPSHNLRQIPFTGKESIIRNLQMACQRGGIVFLQGESGSGKTRILQEFINQHTLPGPLFRMNANYFQKKMAYHPVLENFRENLTEDDWRKINSFWGIQLIPLFPELQQYWSGTLIDESVMMDNQINVMEALHQLIRKIAEDGRITILLDDAQWADTDTLNLLIYLAQRHLFKDKGVLIIAYQPEIDNPLLHEILLNQHSMEPFTMIEIEPLTLEEISQISYSIFRNQISDQLSKRIDLACGGNSFFVIETMRAMTEMQGSGDEKQWSKLPLAGTVHATLRNRLNLLPPLSRQIAECAAIIGDPFTFPEIQVALEIDEISLIRGIDALILSEMVTLESKPFMKNVYRFKFEFLREVAALETSNARKEILHLRLANAKEKEFQATKDSHLLPKIAVHFAEGGEPITAFNYWVQFARSLHTTFNERSAFDAYQNALDIANSLTRELSSEQMYDLYIGWGDLALFRHELDIADMCYKKAILEGQKRNDPYLLGAGFSGQGELYGLRSIFFLANQYLDHAANFLDLNHFGEFIRVKNRKVNLLLQQSMPSQAILLLKEIAQLFPLAKTEFDHLMVAESNYFLASAYLYAGEYNNAYEICKTIEKTLRTHHNPPLQSRVELILGTIAYSKGEFQKAIDHYGVCLQISEFYSAWNMALQASIYTSYAMLKLGKLYQSWDHIKNCFHLSEVYEFVGTHGLIFNAQARVFLYLGNLNLAKEYFEKALSFSLSKYQILFNQKDLGFTQYLMGEKETGLENLQEVIQLCQLYGFTAIELIGRSEQAMLLYLDTRNPDLLIELRNIAEITRVLGIAGAGSAYAYLSALEAMHNQQQYTVAEEFINQLVEIGKKEKSLWFEWHTIELTYQLHLAQGMDTKEDLKKRDKCILTIKQMIPNEIKRTINLEFPPLAGLV